MPAQPKLDFAMLAQCTQEQLKEYGFYPWDSSGLMLIPERMIDRIPAGFELMSINGTKTAFDHDRDGDYRFGYLAFGIYGTDSPGRS
jgi:hypothetical protein